MDITSTVLQCNKPTEITGRIYPRSVVEAAIKKFQPTIDADLAFVYATVLDGIFEEPKMSELAGKITKMFVNERDQVVVNIKTLDTPAGRIIDQCSQNLRFTLAAVGCLDENKTATDYEIIHVVAIPAEQ